jgi:hypothetical protein
MLGQVSHLFFPLNIKHPESIVELTIASSIKCI